MALFLYLTVNVASGGGINARHSDAVREFISTVDASHISRSVAKTFSDAIVFPAIVRQRLVIGRQCGRGGNEKGDDGDERAHVNGTRWW
jgi:hypothetical protein